MIYALILAASLAHAQESSSPTVSVPLATEITISNLGKDTKNLLGGRYRQTGKPTFAGGICFSDGTCQTTAPSAGITFASSFTVVSPDNTSQATFNLAFATVTTTVRNVPLEVCIRGNFSQTTSARSCWGILVDGAYVGGMSATKGINCWSGAGVGYSMDVGECHQLAALGAGSKAFALTLMSDVTVTWPATATGASALQLNFGVREVPTTGLVGATGATGATGAAGAAGAAGSNGTNGVDAQMTSLTGDVVASGIGAVAATIQASAVDTGKIKSDSVDSTKIITGAVNTYKLATDSVSNAKILNGSVDTYKLAANAVNTGKMSADTVTTVAIISGAVNTFKIATDSVNSSKIIAGAVDTYRLAVDSVGSTKILNGSVDTYKLIANAVNTGKLAADAVTSVILLNASVNTFKIATDSVNSSKIIAGAVDTYRLALDSVGTTHILNASVNTYKLAVASVDTNKLAADSVTGIKILNSTIDTAKLNIDLRTKIWAAASGAGHRISTSTQYGSGAVAYPTRSTLTFDSSFFVGIDSVAMDSTFVTLSTAPGGVVPFAFLTRGSQNVNNATETQIFFETASTNDDAMWVIASSGSVTVPTGQDGNYAASCTTQFDPSAVGRRIVYVYVNSTIMLTEELNGSVGLIYESLSTHGALKLVAGDVVQCRVYQTSGANININGKMSLLKVPTGIAIGPGLNSTNTWTAPNTFTAPVSFSTNMAVGMTYTTTNACALATTCSVSCAAGTYLTSGGCLNGTLTFGVSGTYPSSSNTWVCDSTGAVGITAYAICSRLSP